MSRHLHPVVVALIGVAAFCVACRNTASTDGPPEVKPLRVLSYNIHHGAGVDRKLDLERIAGILKRSGADLIALQEVDRVVQRTGKVDQLQELARLTGMHPAFARFMDYGGGKYGLAILSRYPIDHSWPILLPPGKAEPRSALAIRVEHPGFGPVTFVCLHFDWIDDDTQRYAQAQALLAALGDVAGTVILAGDFNDRPGSRTLRLILGQFTHAAKPEDANGTFPAPKPDREIDFVMFRPTDQIEGLSHVLDEGVASDHRPVLAELRYISPPSPPVTPSSPGHQP